MGVKMGNIVIDYQKTRAALRLERCELWQAECIAGLLQRHDDRVAKETLMMLVLRRGSSRISW